MTWIDKFDIDDPISGGLKHVSGDSQKAVSTIYAIDTEKWESMFITADNVYRLLQVYETAHEAREGHTFWAKKVKEGFVPEGHLANNFTSEACLRFLELAAKGKYQKG